MRVLCLNEKMDNCPSYRARVLPFLSLFKNHNIEIDLPNFNPSMPISVARKYDLVWLRRLLFLDSNSWKKLKNTPIIYELDDAIYFPQDSNNYKNFQFMMKRVDLVIAGSMALAEEALKCGARKVQVIRTGVDLSKYPLSHSNSHKIVWTGSASTLPYLYSIEHILKDLGKPTKVICDKIPTWQVNSENVMWNTISQFNSLKDCTVGISPLPDNLFTRGKCAYKMIQYMACGLPIIVSSVGANKDIFDLYNCVGSCVPTNEKFSEALIEWTDTIKDGLKNRKIVEEHFDVPVLFDEILKCFNEVL